MARPDAVLFNGGFFTPALARDRVLDALAAWFGARPRVLENAGPEAAVAIGAAFYGRLRQDPGGREAAADPRRQRACVLHRRRRAEDGAADGASA